MYSVQVKVNVECDRLASEVSKRAIVGDHQINTEDVIQPPYEGSKAVIKINSRWTTSNLKDHVLYVSHIPKIRTYYNTQFEWQEGTFDTVYWISVKRHRIKIRLHESHQTSKIMVGYYLQTNVGIYHLNKEVPRMQM